MRTIFLNEESECEALGVSALVLGNFDGAHIGHRALFDRAETIQGKADEDKWALMTFEPHPKDFFKQPGFIRVFSPEDGIKSLEKAGVHLSLIYDFTQNTASKSPNDFLSEVIQKVKPTAIVVGEDFRFGSQRQGSVFDIKRWASVNDTEVIVVKLLNHSESEKISSTQIRELLSEGKVFEANKYLLSPFFISGFAKREKGLATQLGFPTINVILNRVSNLKYGVYCSRIKLQDKYYEAVTNFGVRPTVESEALKTSLETHVLNFPKNLEGVSFEAVEIEFLDFLRPESRFADIASLKQQIKQDVERATLFFSS